jgi:cytochrome c-type biogenesis protein CcmF
MFVALAPFLALLLGIGPAARWKHDSPWRLTKMLWLAFALSIVLLALSSRESISGGDFWVPIGIALAGWLLFSHLTIVRDRLKHKKQPLWQALKADFSGNGRSFYGMVVAHLGVAMFIVGVTMVSNHQIEKDLRMSPGDSHEMAGYRFEFLGAQKVNGPNYRADRGHFRVYRGDRQIAELYPEKRSYLGGGMPMTEAAIDAGFFRDVYVSLGEAVGGGDWALRLYYKPYVRWIWLGAVLMALGGTIAVSDRRYRSASVRSSAPAAAATARA